MAVIGIDLGTTYSAAAIMRDGHPEIIDLDGEPILPSVVGVLPNGKIAVGKIAKRNQAKNPQATIVEIKRDMGTDRKVPLGEETRTPQEISSYILSKIKELAEAQLSEPISGVVISCPTYFQEPARRATEQAAELAGMRVLQTMNEPTAAAYAYGLAHGNDDAVKLFLVYDLGGGTFDVTVIKMIAGSLDVIGTGGDPQLGGGNFDDCIVDWMLELLQKKHPAFMATINDEKREALKLRLKSYAEPGKKALCDSQAEAPTYKFNIPQVAMFEGRPLVFDETLTMVEFETRIDELLTKSFHWVEEALKEPKKKHQYDEQDITAILLVGGSTRVPLVRRKLEERFPELEIRGQASGINPDEIVALGASIVAAEEDPEGDVVSDIQLVDVTGHSLSVAFFDTREQRQRLQSIIPKDTPIPESGEHRFQSTGNFQVQCQVSVYQGEGDWRGDGSAEIDLDKVKLIKQFSIGVPPREECIPLRIGLQLDSSGMLIAHATEEAEGQSVTCNINYEDSVQMSPQELERKKAEQQAKLDAFIGQTVNPLDGAARPASGVQPETLPGTPSSPMMGSSPGVPQPGLAAPPMPPSMQPQPVAQRDPTAAMNPILRSLYNKAINEYGNIPEDRKPAVMQLVQEIETAALADDQARLAGYLPTLDDLLSGI